MTSVLFLGSKVVGARCLQALLDHGADVVAVVAGRSRNALLEGTHDVRAVAEAAGLRLVADVATAPVADLLVSVQHHAVLNEEELALGRAMAVNLHLAPLPEYRGANQFTFAILDGAVEFGVTLHQMIPKVDAGPVLAERRFPIAEGSTAWELYRLSVEEAVELFTSSVDDLLARRLSPIDQAAIRPDTPRRFHRKDEVAHLKRLDPAWPFDRIDRHVRALDMPGYEPAYFEHDGRRLYVTTWPGERPWR